MYVVSACLLGHNCKYNGGNNLNQAVIDFLKDKEYVLVCPETAGGLTAPREPAERIGDKVIDRAGRNVTEQFIRGAEKSLEYIEGAEGAEGAILKANSPSCGSCKIYDGTFTGTLTEGDGVFTEMLKKQGIKVMTEEDLI